MCGRFSYSLGRIKDSEESGSKSCPQHEKPGNGAIDMGIHLCSLLLSELGLGLEMQDTRN